MQSLFVFTAIPAPCSYLPDRDSSLTYEVVGALSAAEYQARLRAGWRRFGFTLFHPTCPGCTECRSLRVPVATFRPDRSQRRCLAANAGDLRHVIGVPSVSRAKLELYDRFHAAQADRVGWTHHGPKQPSDYAESFVDNPFASEEWCYYLGERLVGVGYVDRVPEGLSLIYFFHDPDERQRSLGTFNVLWALREAERATLPHVYLGYYVKGCRSLEYKARFRPVEARSPAGEWSTFDPG
ncbi:MAG: arginyltransferase [Gemmata sp.]